MYVIYYITKQEHGGIMIITQGIRRMSTIMYQIKMNKKRRGGYYECTETDFVNFMH